ncbi:hypothetical protein D8M38_02925 [Kocuria sp. HSID17582]|nr:hypothetical protein D8M39_09835 [Kocuria sp. HSID17590]RUQ11448.1 hypothetical protein D8M38_02925 [Kocuria sp. HSID17582]
MQTPARIPARGRPRPPPPDRTPPRPHPPRAPLPLPRPHRPRAPRTAEHWLEGPGNVSVHGSSSATAFFSSGCGP